MALACNITFLEFKSDLMMGYIKGKVYTQQNLVLREQFRIYWLTPNGNENNNHVNK